MTSGKTVLQTGKSGIATTFTGMNLLNIAKGRGVHLSAEKEEHLRVAGQVGGAVNLTQMRREKLIQIEQREHGLDRKTAEKIVSDHIREQSQGILSLSNDIAGRQGGACGVPVDRVVRANQHLADASGHVFKPGDNILMRHGTTICPKCGHALKGYKPGKVGTRRKR